MISNPTIRPAGPQDLESIRQIAGATGLFPPKMLNDIIEPYLEGRAEDIWFVCLQGSEPVGFGFCEPERMTQGTWNLLAIGVLPSAQGAGTGTAMMQYLEGRLRSGGARVLIVETMGTAEFERTRQFYKNNDYCEEARIREFYEPGADKIVFWKHL